jgi:hypothetical protein
MHRTYSCIVAPIVQSQLYPRIVPVSAINQSTNHQRSVYHSPHQRPCFRPALARTRPEAGSSTFPAKLMNPKPFAPLRYFQSKVNHHPLHHYRWVSLLLSYHDQLTQFHPGSILGVASLQLNDNKHWRLQCEWCGRSTGLIS